MTDNEPDIIIEEIARKHAVWYSLHIARIVDEVYFQAFLHGAKHQKQQLISQKDGDK